MGTFVGTPRASCSWNTCSTLNLSSFLRASFLCSGVGCMYRIVVEISECPISSLSVGRSTPARDARFPKRPEPQRNFLADSLAGRGLISPRRSRDICERERKTKVHYIIRQDYYIECTCRYKGPARYGQCPKCGTDRAYPPIPVLNREFYKFPPSKRGPT